jgi:hypothetical protein
MRRLLGVSVLLLAFVLVPSALASPSITGVTINNGAVTVAWTNVPGETAAQLEIASSPDTTPNGFELLDGAFVTHVVYSDSADEPSLANATGWTFTQPLPLGAYYVHVEDVAPIPFGCALNDPPTCPLNDWSPVVSFQVTKGNAAPPPKPKKPPPDTVTVNTTIEGGANQWIKVDGSYEFGDFVACAQSNADIDPECNAPSYDLTVIRISHVRRKIGKHRYRTVTVRKDVYDYGDNGINNGSGGGDCFIPPLVPGADFVGGARSGTYVVRLTATFTFDSESDSSTFSISNHRIY